MENGLSALPSAGGLARVSRLTPPGSPQELPTRLRPSENKSSFSEDSATFLIRQRSEGSAVPTEAPRKQDPAQPLGAFPV